MGDVHRHAAAGLCRRLDPSAALVTAWPPNWLRSAATAFIAGESSWRETNRANIEARDRRQRDRVVDGLLDGPPALAGVLDVALDVAQSSGSCSSARTSRSSSQDRIDRAALPGLEGARRRP